jgi:hypothetical protein
MQLSSVTERFGSGIFRGAFYGINIYIGINREIVMQ